jgi:hypothetical protein
MLHKMKAITCLGIFVFAASLFAQADLPDLAKIKIAAEGGDPVAQEQLAEAYLSRGDNATGVFWYRKAALQNRVPAQAKLGHLLLVRYEYHMDAKPEIRGAAGVEARKWILLAANEGDKSAQAEMAQLCMAGSLFSQSYVEAYKWGELAARGLPGDTATFSGKATRDTAILKMTTAQIEEARKRVENFVPKTIDASPAKSKTP